MERVRVVYHGISHESCSMVYHERALHNYFMPCHRKYSDQHNHGTYAWRTMGRLDLTPSKIQWFSCVLIGCIFYGIPISLALSLFEYPFSQLLYPGIHFFFSISHSVIFLCSMLNVKKKKKIDIDIFIVLRFKHEPLPRTTGQPCLTYDNKLDWLIDWYLLPSFSKLLWTIRTTILSRGTDHKAPDPCGTQHRRSRPVSEHGFLIGKI